MSPENVDPKTPPHENMPPSSPPPSPLNGAQLPPSSWRRGVSPNPGGAPRGKRISTWLVELGQLPPSEWPDPARLPANAQIAMARLKRAMGEDGERAAEIVLDRTEGGVNRTLHLTANQDAPPMSLREAAKLIRQAGLGGPDEAPGLAPPDSGV